MAMTAEQMIEFFKEQAEMSWNGIEGAKKSGEYELAAFNASGAFDAALMTGLIQWRLGEDPRQSLARACGFVKDGLAVLDGLRPGTSHWVSFDFSTVGFLELLLDQAVPHRSEPDPSLWRNQGLDHVEQFLDRGLVGAIRSGQEPSDWGGLLASLPSDPRLGLLRETYSTYMEAITGRSSTGGDALGAASRAVSLFKRRESDGFYAGGRAIDGGGPDNGVVVDFRLAAVVRYRLPKAESSFRGEERVHLWKW